VVEAVCKAAAELFAERGPAAVAGREIAARAGVNYGLIHRHFGSREELQRQVMTRLAADLTVAFEEGRRSGRSPLATLAEHPTYSRALARAALDGEDLASLQDEHPVIEDFRSRLKARSSEGEDELTDRMSLAFVTAAVLGWNVFGSFLRSALDLESIDDAELNAGLGEALARVFRRSGG
jgi:AcrR family transcriptional regulator